MVTNILNPNHLLFQPTTSPDDPDHPQLNIQTISSADPLRDQYIKKLVELFNFWNIATQDNSQVNNDKIKETLIAFADYFDNIFANSDDIKEITATLLRDHDISKFYKSIENHNDAITINLMKFFVEHGLTLASIYEKSRSENKSDVLEKIMLNLIIFPAHQYQDQTTDIDFICLAGTYNRIMQAHQALFATPIYQISIREAVQKIENALKVFVRQGNHVHLNKTVLSLISLHKIDDSFFRGPDQDISIFEINNLIKKFKKTISESIHEELDKLSEQILNAQTYDDINAIIDLFKLDQKLPDLEVYLYGFFKEDVDHGDYVKINPDNFKTKDQITEILETLLIKNSPAIYYQEDQTSKDALDFLNSLDVYCDDYPEFLDHLKINNLLKLLMPNQEDPDRVKKIEAGILFLHLLARDFKESDPVFFLMVLDKLEERNPAQIDQDGQVTKSFLQVYYDSIPEDLKQEGFDTQRIIDYINAKKIEKYRGNFSENYISYEKYKAFIVSGEITPGDDPNRLIDCATSFNHLNALKKITESGGQNESFFFELIIENFMRKNKLNSLLALLDDDRLFTEGDVKITPESVNSILYIAVRNNNIKLVLSAIKRGADVMQLIHHNSISDNYVSLLHFSTFFKFDDISIALLEEACSKNISASEDEKKIFYSRLSTCLRCLSTHGNIKIFRKFLEKLPPSSIDNELFNDLILENKYDFALLLIEKLADVNEVVDRFERSLLQIAIVKYQNGIALALIEKGADVNAIDPQTKKSLLQIAIVKNQNNIALALIKKGANVNVIDPQTKKSLLQIAIEEDQNDIALALIEKGANVNAIDPQTQKSLLQIAIQGEKIEIALKLIERDADFDCKILNCVLDRFWDSQQQDALELLKKIFVKKPELLTIINNPGDSQYPLLAACEKHNYLMVEYLLHSEDIPADERANPNIHGLFRHNTAIIEVCKSWSDSSTKLKMIESLKKAGANLKFEDKNGFDLCAYAIKIKGSSQFFEEIYNNRSAIEKIRNRFSGRNKKLLEMATKEGNLECVSFLYDKLSPQSLGCFPYSCLTISNQELENLFHIALANNSIEVAKFFIEKDSNIIDSNNKNGDREIETCLKEFLVTSDEVFMISYRFLMSEADRAEQEMDIVNISLGNKIKFLVENNCEISEKFNQILENFRLQNPNPNPNPNLLTDDGEAVEKKLEFLEKIGNLIQSRSPNPLSTSASAQVVQAQGPAQERARPA